VLKELFVKREKSLANLAVEYFESPTRHPRRFGQLTSQISGVLIRLPQGLNPQGGLLWENYFVWER
jgi:hypothetical protein